MYNFLAYKAYLKWYLDYSLYFFTFLFQNYIFKLFALLGKVVVLLPEDILLVKIGHFFVIFKKKDFTRFHIQAFKIDFFLLQICLWNNWNSFAIAFVDFFLVDSQIGGHVHFRVQLFLINIINFHKSVGKSLNII